MRGEKYIDQWARKVEVEEINKCIYYTNRKSELIKEVASQILLSGRTF